MRVFIMLSCGEKFRLRRFSVFLRGIFLSRQESLDESPFFNGLNRRLESRAIYPQVKSGGFGVLFNIGFSILETLKKSEFN